MIRNALIDVQFVVFTEKNKEKIFLMIVKLLEIILCAFLIHMHRFKKLFEVNKMMKLLHM